MAKYFKDSEFNCRCGIPTRTHAYPALELLQRLDTYREALGEPVIVLSGVRCKEHNLQVGGEPKSAHIIGYAADIRCNNSIDRFKMVKLAQEVFKRVGIGKGFIHVDCAPNFLSNVLWLAKDQNV